MKIILTIVVTLILGTLVINAQNQLYKITSKNRCFSFVNRFVIEDQEMLRNPDLIFYMVFDGKEYPLTKNNENGELIGQVGSSIAPELEQEKVYPNVIVKDKSGKIIHSQKFSIPSVRRVQWHLRTLPEKFHKGSNGYLMITHISRKGLAANNCIESLTFVDSKGFYQLYTRNSANNFLSLKNGDVSVRIKTDEFAVGDGKLIVKQYDNPVTFEIPLRLYGKPPGEIKVQLKLGEKSGKITASYETLSMLTTGGSITYCPKGYFDKLKEQNKSWENNLQGCVASSVRIQGSSGGGGRNILDYGQKNEMIANSDSTAVFTAEIQDGRKFSYLFTFEN